MIEKFAKYGVQDVGVSAICYLHGVHVEVARMSQENKMWVLTPAGAALLAADSDAAIESEVFTPKQRRQKRSTPIEVLEDVEE